MNLRKSSAKVRHGLVHVTLDVPDDVGLLAWGTTAHKPLAGHVTFFETGGRTACGTLVCEQAPAECAQRRFPIATGPI